MKKFLFVWILVLGLAPIGARSATSVATVSSGQVNGTTSVGSIASQDANNVAITGGTISGVTGLNGSGAPQTVTYQPGLLTAVNATIGVFKKFTKASTVNNIVGSAITFSCVANPTITMYECGTSTTCAAPTTIGTVTVTAAGTRTDGTVSNPAIAAGDSVAWAMTAGTCASVDISANAEVTTN